MSARKLKQLAKLLAVTAVFMAPLAHADLASSVLTPPDVLPGSSPGVDSRMVAYFNATTCPVGWRESNGSNGTRDLRGEFIRGLDRGRGVDTGRTLGSAQLDQMQRITGDVTFGGIEGSGGVVTGASGSFTRSSNAGHPAAGGGYAGSYSRRLSFDSARQTRAGDETRPRNVALLACQKD